MAAENRVDFLKSQGIELVGAKLVIGIIDLVGDHHDLLAGALQVAGNTDIFVLQTGAGIEEENDGIGLLNRDPGLLGDLHRKRIVGPDQKPAGVDQHEIDAVPACRAIEPVACHPGHVINDGILPLDEAVKEG